MKMGFSADQEGLFTSKQVGLLKTTRRHTTFTYKRQTFGTPLGSYNTAHRYAKLNTGCSLQTCVPKLSNLNLFSDRDFRTKLPTYHFDVVKDTQKVF